MSTDLSKQYHSIIIDGINTWDDWHLIPSSRPTITVPAVTMNQIVVPGADGFIDLTEFITGRITYGPRTGSWEFIAHPDYADTEPWHDKYSKILRYLHGRNISKLILEDDPFFYYTGRLQVDQWKSGESWSTISIKYALQPYKKEIISSDEQWEWDTFSFVNGIIRAFSEPMQIRGSKTITIRNGDEPVVPTFAAYNSAPASGNMKVTNNTTGVELTLQNDYTTDSSFVLNPGDNELVFTGIGTIYSIKFRAGWL